MRFRTTVGSQAVMAPNHHFALNSMPLEPVSRTYQYRKIMKPMLERKRRARINKCLDELKDLMTGTLQADGENVSKLEKADILELTVRHLHRLRENNNLFMRPTDPLNMEKFWAGFHHCATEVSKFLTKYDNNIGGDIIKHITNFVPNISSAATAATTVAGVTAVNYQKYPSHQITPSLGEYYASEKKSLSLTFVSSLERRQKQHFSNKDVTTDDGIVWRPW